MADSILTKTLKDVYKSILRVNDNTNGVDSTQETVCDGDGNETPLKLSTTGVGVQPSSNNSAAFSVVDNSSNTVFSVDTTNKLAKSGSSQYIVNSNSFYFSGSNIDPTGAGYHMAIPCGGTYLGGATDELDFGNGSDPALSLDISGLTEDTDVMHYYWYLSHDIEVTSMECFFGSESGTPTCNFHLYNYTLDKSNGAGSGDLSSGLIVGNTSTQATSASTVNYKNASIITRTCPAGSVLVATIESDADVLLHAKVCVKYHLV